MLESNLAEAKREVVEFESEAGRQFARVRSDRASAAYLALFKPAAKRRTLDSQWRDWRRKTLELFRESSVLEYLPPDLLRESARFLSKRDLPNPRDFVYTLASISDDETSFDLLRRWIRAHKGGDFKMDLEALKAMNVFPKTKDPDSRIGFGRTRICGNSSCHDFVSIEDIEWQNLGAADGRLRILTPRWSADSAIYPYEQFSESIALLPPELQMGIAELTRTTNRETGFLSWPNSDGHWGYQWLRGESEMIDANLIQEATNHSLEKLRTLPSGSEIYLPRRPPKFPHLWPLENPPARCIAA